jgi:hypothetical protein
MGSLSPRTPTPLRRIIMDTKKRFIILAVSSVVVAFGALSCATAGGTKIPLMATKMQPSASGTSSVSDKSLSIQAKGLQPNAVYTVWFVNMGENMKPKTHAGAGMPPYVFKTDSSGAGTYESGLEASPFGKWQMLMIMLHPDGDPTNLKDAVGTLSAKLMK